jgi:L-ascorbate metabolism protein UlaG (beta-lactamase superfamily)
MNTHHPTSDHWDGEHFFTPGAATGARGWVQVLRWRFGGKRAVWERPPPDPGFPPPPSVVAAGTAAVTFINHASFLIRLRDRVLLTDPIFSDRCSPVPWAGPKRVRPPGLALADLPRPDIVLVTHNHYDHMDIPSLREIQQRHAPRFITMLGNAATLRKHGIEATELDWWEDASSGPVTITATPARHFSARTPFDRNRTLWGGFMIESPDGRILFAGDSGAGPHWRDIGSRLGAPDLALLPIGAYEPRWMMAAVHMNPAEAVQAHLTLGATRSVGMHFGTFQLTDEPIDAPPHALADARAAANLNRSAFDTQGFGETRLYELARGRRDREAAEPSQNCFSSRSI